MSRSTLVIVCLVLTLVGVTWLALQSPATAATPTAKPRFVLNLTSGQSELHRSTMALALANHALDDGREVIIFLNVRAPELARKDALEQTFGENPAPSKMLASLMERGAQVHVCPMCMKAMGVAADAMIPGCIVTDREKLFGKLTTDTVVFSY